MADHTVSLRIPTSTERVRLARTMVAVMADDAGFDYDDVEDLRIAVDELCFALIDVAAPDGILEIRADAAPGTLEVEGTIVEGSTSPAAELSELTRQILSTVVGSYELVTDGDAPCFRFTKTKP